MTGSDLGRRVAVAVVGIPVGVAVTYLGAWAVAIVVGGIAALGAAEVYRIAEARGWQPFRFLGVPAAGLLVLAAAWADGLQAWAVWGWIILLAVLLASLASAVFMRGTGGDPLLAVSTTLFGVLYTGATLSFAVHLRSLPQVGGGAMGWEGALILIFPMTVTWIGDSGAYFSGMRWGRRKLLPSVSPAKTVEGGVGGLVGAMLGSLAFSVFLLGPWTAIHLPVGSALLLGLILGAVAQVADLAESLLKREAGVKDSGAILPGHGGVLDRFDAVLFTLPLTYLLLPWLIR